MSDTLTRCSTLNLADVHTASQSTWPMLILDQMEVLMIYFGYFITITTLPIILLNYIVCVRSTKSLEQSNNEGLHRRHECQIDSSCTSAEGTSVRTDLPQVSTV